MRRLLCALAALAFICVPAIAENGEFAGGGRAGYLNGEYYMTVDEGETYALARIAGEKAYVAQRADELGDMVSMDGALYMLRRTGDIWEIVGLNGGEWQVYAFAAGQEVSCLGARDGSLFVLVDGLLHIVYPGQGLCLQLAGAQMREYVLAGDTAYYISADTLTEHRLAAGDGSTAETQAGALCAVELSTGKKTVLLAAGASELKYYDGRLYFHSYADCYLMLSGDGMTMAGRLYGYDIAAGEFVRLTDDYDWDYAAGSEGVLVYREGAAILLGADGAEDEICRLPSCAELALAENALVWYDPETQTFTVLPDGGAATTAR